MFNGFNCSVIGASHVKKNIVCQDSSAYVAYDDFSVAVVADGHGSKKHFRSHIGSRMAVESAIDTIRNFFSDYESITAELPENHNLIIHNIEKQIIARWHKKITKHFAKNPVTEDEKNPFDINEFESIPFESYYGTTLVVGVMGKNFTFGFQIGDGSLVAVLEDGNTVMIMDYEESNPANITASICNKNAPSMFSHFYTDSRKIIALFVSTDGLYTSFGSDNDFLSYHTIIAGKLCDIETFKSSVVKNITKRTCFGTEDDISLACVYDDLLVESKYNVLQKKIENNKKKTVSQKLQDN